MDQFDELLARGYDILWQLFPYDTSGLFSANTACTIAIDALDDYLWTGQISPVPEGDTLADRFHITGRMHPEGLREIINAVLRRGHGSWAVVRGIRPDVPLGDLTRDHWFIIVNIRSTVYLADPYAHVVRSYIRDFAREQGLVQFAYHGSWEAEQFEATPRSELDSPHRRPRRRGRR